MHSIHGCFSRKKIVVFRFSNSLASFEISNQNHHRQACYNYNILTQIIGNLLGKNTTWLTWKFLQYGDWITHMDYFKRVEQMLITLLKTHEYVMINIQAIRVVSHKHSLQIVWKQSNKWQRNCDLKEIWKPWNTWLGLRLNALHTYYLIN